MASYDKEEDNTKNTEKENDDETVHEQVKIKKYVRKTNRKDGAQNIIHSKKTRNINQSFKDRYLTLKFNLSVLQSKVGKSADFVLLVKDNIHNENAVPCSPLAGKTLVCSQGELGKVFFNGGLSYDSDNCYVMANAKDFTKQIIESNNGAVEILNKKKSGRKSVAKGEKKKRTDSIDDDSRYVKRTKKVHKPNRSNKRNKDHKASNQSKKSK